MEDKFVKVNTLLKMIRDLFRCQLCFDVKDENSIIFYWGCEHIFCLDCIGEGNPCAMCPSMNWDCASKQVKITENDSILAVFRSSQDYKFTPDKKVNKRDGENNSLPKAEEETPKRPLRTTSKVKADTPKVDKSEEKNKSKAQKRFSRSSVKENYSESVLDQSNDNFGKRSVRGQLKSHVKENNVVSEESSCKAILKSKNQKISSTPKQCGDNNNDNSFGKRVVVRKNCNSNPNGSSKKCNKSKGSESESRTLRDQLKSTPKKNEMLNVSKELEKNVLSSGSKKIKNVTKRNHKGETPLHLASRKGNISLMQELIDAGANLNVQDNAGWTPLHDSIAFGRTEIVKFLIENGARVNTPGHENTTALHQAVVEGNTEVASLLLQHGADRNARNIYGETPLDLVKKYNLTLMEEVMMSTPDKFKKSICNVREETITRQSKEEVILCAVKLNENETSVFEKFTKLFGYKTVDKLSPQLSATHIVLTEDENEKVTWSIIPGVLMACQVVSIKWMKDSVENNTDEPLEKYEVTSDFFAGFSKSRQNQLNQLPGLFSGCHFYFGGNFEMYKTKNSSFLKMELKVLVEKHGGVILSRNPDPESLALKKTIPYHADVNGSLARTSYYIIYSRESWDPVPKYNMAHMKTLPVEWLLASIFKFELIDPNVTQSYMEYI